MDRLSYDEKSGIFVWKMTINRRFIGQPAGWLGKRGYIQINVGDERHYAHRLAWLFYYGEWPMHMVDHINNNRTDNRISNLRGIPQVLNGQNVPWDRRPASGLTGVIKQGQRYKAEMMLRGKHVYLGMHDTPEQAHAAYVQAKKMLHPLSKEANDGP
jgi:hypothetical protein